VKPIKCPHGVAHPRSTPFTFVSSLWLGFAHTQPYDMESYVTSPSQPSPLKLCTYCTKDMRTMDGITLGEDTAAISVSHIQTCHCRFDAQGGFGFRTAECPLSQRHCCNRALRLIDHVETTGECYMLSSTSFIFRYLLNSYHVLKALNSEEPGVQSTQPRRHP